WLIDARASSTREAEIRAVGAVSRAEVTMAADFDDAEVDAYVASGEPLKVAGGFTIDSLGSAYIDRIVGDPSTVVGLSVPTLRRLAKQLDVPWSDFWNRKSD